MGLRTLSASPFGSRGIAHSSSETPYPGIWLASKSSMVLVHGENQVILGSWAKHTFIWHPQAPPPCTQPCPKPPGSTPAQRPALAPRVPQLHGRHQPPPQPPPAASPSPGRGFEDFSAASNSRSHRLCSEPLVGPRSRRSLRRPGSEAGDLAQDFAHLSPPPLHPAHSPERSVKSLHDGILLCYFNAILAQA